MSEPVEPWTEDEKTRFTKALGEAFGWKPMTTPTADEIDALRELEARLASKDAEETGWVMPIFSVEQARALLALNDAARDAERLDWLLDRGWYPTAMAPSMHDPIDSVQGPKFLARMRAAIDAAINANRS